VGIAFCHVHRSVRYQLDAELLQAQEITAITGTAP
jgi:hypothetical protein